MLVRVLVAGVILLSQATALPPRALKVRGGADKIGKAPARLPRGGAQNSLIGRVCTRMRNEFAIDNLDFDASTKAIGLVNWRGTFGHDTNRCFRSQHAYLRFRVLLLALMLGTTVWSFLDMALKGEGAYWLIYLTHWGLLLEVGRLRARSRRRRARGRRREPPRCSHAALAQDAYLALAVYTTYKSVGWKAADGDSKALPWFVRRMWLLNAMILPASFLIFVMYVLASPRAIAGDAKTSRNRAGGARDGRPIGRFRVISRGFARFRAGTGDSYTTAIFKRSPRSLMA